MSSQPHPAVLAVHDAADAVLNHRRETSSGSFWRRWFEKPQERHFADEVRAFVTTLDFLLDVPPQMLSRGDLVAVGEDADRVVKRVEEEIDEQAAPAGEVAVALAPAVYVIRTRYEELYTRGAGR
ncbi:MAG TPA: hypothetical protein VGZ27_14685 [Vicinamibacterales bacterium]|jgi:hypothetical protein|nr:hypothetical protein [Vicinamibacterales bacterium]